MIKKKVKVQNAAGIHARPASIIVKEATRFESEFHIHMYGYRINGKSILGLLTLAAEHGAELELEWDGPDEEVAMDKIVSLFYNGFKLEED